MSVINLELATASSNAETDGAIVTQALDLSISVVETDKYVPLTGVFSSEVDNKGWKWDKRQLEDWSKTKTRYNTFVGGHSVGLKDGTLLTDWQSGSVDGTQYKDLVARRVAEGLTWTPRVQPGMFSVRYDARPLFSDHSYAENIDRNLTVDDLMRMPLQADVIPESIYAAIYRRTSDLLIMSHWTFGLVTEFTGEIDTAANTRLETFDDSGDLILENISPRFKEMLVLNDTLIFNGDHKIQRGDSRQALLSVVGTWESKGCGLGSGRVLYADYFPFQTGSVSLATIDNAGNITEWEEQASLNFSGPTDRHFSVCYDLGVIQMGGYQAPDLVLSSEIDFTVTEFDVFCDPETFASYPDTGVVQIGAELILYTEKSRSGFRGCIRGYSDTVPSNYARGTLVSDRQHGLGTTDSIYVRYTAVPKVEYETTTYLLRTANKAPWLNVHPVSNVITNAVLQILSANINLATVVLETDAELIGGNLYGPVYYGTDVAKLTARGLDSRGNPVDDIDLTIEIVGGEGTLNGSNSSYTARTNTLGEIYAFYNAPYGLDQMDQSVLSVVHEGADTVVNLERLSAAAIPNDIWIFQILKHDPIFGTIGDKLTVVDGGTATRPNMSGYLEVDGILSEDYKDGVVYVLETDNVKRQYDIVDVTRTIDTITREVTSVIWTTQSIDTAKVTGQSSWSLKLGSLEWDQSKKRGARVILYEWTEDAIHPITQEAGAYSPVHPDVVSGTTLRYSGRHFPIPDALDDTNNLGDYIVVAPTEVKFRAKGRDPFTGNIIQSDTLRFKLDLPVWLVGVDRSGTLPIPYGFTLITEEFNVGAGVGGANFITLNPAASGINQFSLTGVIS